MLDLPSIETERLIIRPPADSDIPAMPGVFNDPEIYAYTRNIPYPYTEADAAECLARYRRLSGEGGAITLFPTLRETSELIGLVVLALAGDAPEAELGYAIGRPWWGRGLATEASHALVDHGFEALGLAQINAHAMLRNPASSRVLEKLGMRSIGVMSGACEKDGETFDAQGFVMTRAEWRRAADDRGDPSDAETSVR